MTATRYRAPPADGLRIAALDELTAVYHRASGVTHVVVSPVPELLDALAGAWKTRDAIAARFALGEDDAPALTARLDELVAAGLVELDPPGAT